MQEEAEAEEEDEAEAEAEEEGVLGDNVSQESSKDYGMVFFMFFKFHLWQPRKRAWPRQRKREALSDNVFCDYCFRVIRIMGCFLSWFCLWQVGQEDGYVTEEDYEAKAGECEVLSDNVAGAYKFYRGGCCKFFVQALFVCSSF